MPYQIFLKLNLKKIYWAKHLKRELTIQHIFVAPSKSNITKDGTIYVCEFRQFYFKHTFDIGAAKYLKKKSVYVSLALGQDIFTLSIKLACKGRILHNIFLKTNIYSQKGKTTFQQKTMWYRSAVTSRYWTLVIWMLYCLSSRT